MVILALAGTRNYALMAEPTGGPDVYHCSLSEWTTERADGRAAGIDATKVKPTGGFLKRLFGR